MIGCSFGFSIGCCLSVSLRILVCWDGGNCLGGFDFPLLVCVCWVSVVVLFGACLLWLRFGVVQVWVVTSGFVCIVSLLLVCFGVVMVIGFGGNVGFGFGFV